MTVTRIKAGGLGTDSFNLPVTLNGTDGSSTDAGDNILLDASASGVDAGERLLYEGIPPQELGLLKVNVGSTNTGFIGIGLEKSGLETDLQADRMLHVKNQDDNVPLKVESGQTAAYITFEDVSTTASEKVRVGSNGDGLSVLAGGAERLKISSDGILTIQGENSNTTNATQGVAKFWVNFDGSGTPAARDSFNLASITDLGTGQYQLNIANDMDNDDFSVAGIADTGATALVNFMTFSAGYNVAYIKVAVTSNTAYYDEDHLGCQVWGDLS